MNFIAATVELRSHSSGTVAAYGLEYCSADAVVPGTGSNAEVKLRLLCYNRAGAKLTTFKEWKEGTRALVTGNIVFSDDPAEPLDLLVSTLECNIPGDMYCNGRPICVQGYLREYRKEGDTGSPYRAIVATDFSTRKERERTERSPAPGATASGYSEVDPVPDY